MSDERLIKLTDREIIKIKECLLAKKNNLMNLKQIESSSIEDMNEIINYANQAIRQEIEEIDYIYSKL